MRFLKIKQWPEIGICLWASSSCRGLLVSPAAHAHFFSGLREFPQLARMFRYAHKSVFTRAGLNFCGELSRGSWLYLMVLSTVAKAPRPRFKVSSGPFALVVSLPLPQPLHPAADQISALLRNHLRFPVPFLAPYSPS